MWEERSVHGPASNRYDAAGEEGALRPSSLPSERVMLYVHVLTFVPGGGAKGNAQGAARRILLVGLDASFDRLRFLPRRGHTFDGERQPVDSSILSPEQQHDGKTRRRSSSPWTKNVLEDRSFSTL